MPKVTQRARGQPDLGTEPLQSDFRPTLTTTLLCLFRIVLYLVQVHKQTQIMYYCALYEKKLRQMDTVIQLVSKKKVRLRGNMVL